MTLMEFSNISDIAAVNNGNEESAVKDLGTTLVHSFIRMLDTFNKTIIIYKFYS